jgi:uncharacterized protein (UPF0276 family)
MWRMRQLNRPTIAADAFGLGWRGELAAGILSNLGRIDCLEMIADDWLERPRRELRALEILAERVPISLHGTKLGLASVEPVDEGRLAAFARLVGHIRPACWSEHVAFVRADGIEIGHLAAPPRTTAVLDGAVRNLRRAATVVGAPPLIENVATLIDPPSRMSELEFVRALLEATSSDLLLDLHNLHANATNFRFDAAEFLRGLPAGRIRQVHLAGGQMIGSPSVRRLLDDHLHAVPPVVFGLLEQVASLTSAPMSVILERDGAFPPFAELMAELDRARAAVSSGRAARLTEAAS